MKEVILRNGEKGNLVIDSKTQTAKVTHGALTNLIAFMRNNKVVVKNDILLNDADLAYVRSEMKAFIKKVEANNKKRK